MIGALRRLLGGGDAASQGEPAITVDEPIYAIGDVHGRADLLKRLLKRISDDAAAAAAESPRLVFLGDYVDRGEQSRETLALLRDLESGTRPAPVFLRGNHEALLLQFLDDPETGAHWLRFGGLQTLMSYGVGGVSEQSRGAALTQARDSLAEAIADDLPFLRRLTMTYRSGNAFFCHAGADPARPLDMQEPETLMWRRPGEAEPPRADGVWVIHGHTVVDAPTIGRGRVNVDTGAFFTGRLTALRLGAGPRTFLSS